jgi:hypothetical protein
MVTSWYRIQDADADPQRLLDPANWVSHVWYDATIMCGDCPDASGWTRDGDQPAECRGCRGRGCYNLSERPRRGVSVCRSPGELAAYFAAHHGYLEDTVMVVLEGELASEDDFDEDACLIFPSRVVSVTPVTGVPELAGLLAEAAA